MDYLITADWHIGYQYSSDRRKLNDFFRFFDWIEGKAEAEEAKVIVCGDIFHIRGEIPTSIFNQLLARLEGSSAEFLFMTGNHDLDSTIESSDHHGERQVAPQSIEAFRHLDNVDTVGGSVSFQEGDVNFHIVNYEKDPEKLADLIEDRKGAKLPKADHEVLLGHFGVAEAEMGPANISDQSQLSVDHDCFHWLDYVFTGHYHKPQQWPVSTAVDGDNNETGEYADGGIFIPGSPIQYTFGERGQTKRVLKFSPSDDTVQSIPTKGPEYIVVEDDEDLDRILESDEEMYIRFDMPVPDDAVDELRNHDRVRSAVRNYRTTDVQESRMDVSIQEIDDEELVEDFMDYKTENELLDHLEIPAERLEEAGKELIDESLS